MSSDDDYKLNLDTNDAVASAMKLKEEIISLGEAKNLSGLVNGFISLAGPVAIAGVALFALKEAIDLTKEGEQIERTNKLFDDMAKRSGVASTEMREGIEHATGGTVEMTEAIAAANKAMANLGTNAVKIPEMFELGRKAALVYGGDTVQRFEEISQAIANGNTRMLRGIGLKVDAQAAELKFALSIGTTVDMLTAEEKQHALMNAVLEKGEKNFKNVGEAGESTAMIMTQIGVQFKELGEAIALMISKSGYVKEMVGSWKWALGEISESLKGTFGSELEQSKKRVNDLYDELKYLKNNLAEINSGEQGIMGKLFSPDVDYTKKRIEEVQALIAQHQGKIATMDTEEKARKEKEAEDAKKSGVGGPTPEELNKQREIRAKHEAELLGLRESRIKAEMEIETNAETYEDQLDEQAIIAEEKFDARITQLRAEQGQAGKLNAAEAAQAIEEIEDEKTATLERLARDQEQAQLKVYDNQVKAAKTASQGMVAAFAQGSAQAKKDSQDFGKQGQQTFTSVSNNAVAAFKAMGDGSKSAGEAIKGFLLSSVADYVEMKGKAMLLEGLWPPNPVAIAAGGGMIALSAAMRAAAGSAGGGSSSSGGGASGGGGGASVASQDVSASRPEPSAQQQKSVTIQVQGHYFETEQSKQRMLEMIRENTDATDFKYQQIGVG